MQATRVPVRMADGRAESAGESRTRYLCYAHGLPAPELQYDVFDRAGILVGTTDFAWPEHRLLGEFDGRVKYERYLRPGETPGDAVFREKRREDRLCELLGWRMIRLVWARPAPAGGDGCPDQPDAPGSRLTHAVRRPAPPHASAGAAACPTSDGPTNLRCPRKTGASHGKFTVGSASFSASPGKRQPHPPR